jgi:hypothetical protein
LTHLVGIKYNKFTIHIEARGFLDVGFWTLDVRKTSKIQCPTSKVQKSPAPAKGYDWESR